ncbi:hypothetical protein [Arthrobacter sp. R4-81]
MLANVALSPHAIRELSDFGTASVVRSLNRTLRDTLSAHGSLHLANASEKEKLLSLLKGDTGVPPHEVAAWKETILSLVDQGRLRVGRPDVPFGMGDISSLEQLATLAELHPECPVYVLTEGQLDLLFPGRREGRSPDSAIYVSGVSIGEAEAIATLTDAAQRGNFPRGSKRDDFWDQVLAPLARSAKNISILDRYILKGMQTREDNRPQSNRWDEDVLTWLLRKIDCVEGPAVEVDICAGIGRQGTPHTPAYALALLRRSWKPGDRTRITAINLHVGEWERPDGWLPHDRHIRFGKVSVVALPGGLDRLSSHTVRDLDGMNWTYKWNVDQAQSFRSAEARVRKAHPRLTCTP